MITFKQYLTEKAMHRGAFAEAIKRIGKDVRMGFEFEVFVPNTSPLYTTAKHSSAPTRAVAEFNTLGELETAFSVSKQQLQQMEADFKAWSLAHSDEWIDEHWNDYLDDDVVESEGARAAEKMARRTAARMYSGRTARWADWFKATFNFIGTYGLEPIYGWANDSETEVLMAEPSSQLYHDSWRATAKKLSSAISAALGTQVTVNGGASDKWNLVHDASIKDDDDLDYEHDQAGVGVEIISPPLPFEEAMAGLEQIFTFIDEFRLSTNASTGLHVNISIPDMPARIDPLKLVLFMGDQYTLKQFDRLTNAFTMSQLRAVVNGVELTGTLPRTVPEIKQAAEEALAATSKHYAVNLDKLRAGYLEFRAIGGANYHRKLDAIKNTIGRWILSVELATNPNAERQEYIKKITQLLGKTFIAQSAEKLSNASFKQIVTDASKTAWDQVEDALSKDDHNYRVKALRAAVLVTMSSQDQRPTPSFKLSKDVISLFKQACVTLKDMADITTAAAAYDQVMKFGEIYRLK